MKSKIPSDLKTYLAWRFTNLLPGSFKRNKADFAHHDYPILAPLPTLGRNTLPVEQTASHGPFIYFVCDDKGIVHYVGKSLESQVIHRWVRPGVGGPAQHYWTHATRKGGAVFEIARGLSEDKSSKYELRYIPTSELPADHLERLGVQVDESPASCADKVERDFIRTLCPSWNSN